MPKITWAPVAFRMRNCVFCGRITRFPCMASDLNIGAKEPLDRAHLARLKQLCDRYQPESFSEHLAWSSHGDVFFNDLLPLALYRGNFGLGH